MQQPAFSWTVREGSINRVPVKKRILNSVFWTVFEKSGFILFQFIAQIFIARILSPSDYGFFAILTVITNISMVFINCSFDQAVIQKREITNTELSSVFLFNLLSAIVVYSIIFIVSPYALSWYNRSEYATILKVYYLILLFNSLSLTQTALFQKSLDIKKIAFANLISAVASSVLGVLSAFYYANIWALVIQSLSYSLIYSLMIWYYSAWKPNLILNYKSLRELFRFSSFLAVSQLLSFIFSNLVTILIGKYYSIKETGYYNFAGKLKSSSLAIITSIDQKVNFPLLSRLQDDHEKLKVTFKRTIKMLTYLLCPLILCMLIFAKPLIVALFSESWTGSVIYFKIFMSYLLFYVLNAFNLTILKVKRKTDVLLKLEILNSSILLSAMILGILLEVKIFATIESVINIVGFFINLYFCGRYINYKLKEQLKDIMPMVGISCFIYIFCLLIEQTCIEMPFIVSILLFAAGMVIYMASCYFFNIQEQKYLLGIVKAYILKFFRSDSVS